jgi:hypothetical protein
LQAAAAAAESTGSAASDSVLSPCEQQEQQAGGEHEQGQPAPGILERGWEQQQQAPDHQEREKEQEQQQLAEDASVDWGHLSAQLSAAGFGHLPMVEQQQHWAQPGGLPELAGLHDSLRKVRGRSLRCGYVKVVACAAVNVWLHCCRSFEHLHVQLPGWQPLPGSAWGQPVMGDLHMCYVHKQCNMV